MEKTLEFYEGNELWDFTALNDASIEDLIDQVVAQLSKVQPRFSTIACQIAPEIAAPVSFLSPSSKKDDDMNLILLPHL